MDGFAFTLAHDGMNLPAPEPRPVTDPDVATDSHFDVVHRSAPERAACLICNGTMTTEAAAARYYRAGFETSAHAQANPAGPRDGVA